ncbi:hypothetical protein LTR09_005247 [Extremus antarcticus]|uniref:Uncharacterized protein n=1 Tax=Extremus antarcticus TaxID=702011 RepID=A0AAJ0GDS5_9PEZI|nr:hypothetical protein LTR09_005247 [Extremus antarcticus]
MKTEASEAEKEADRQRMGLDGYEIMIKPDCDEEGPGLLNRLQHAVGEEEGVFLFRAHASRTIL